MERFLFEHMPTELQAVHVALFHQVENAGALRQRLIAASKMQGPEGDAERDQVEYCWLDAGRILSLTHLLTAVHSAALATAHGQLKAQTCHSEILYQLTPTSNIADGLKQFGMSANTKNLLVVRFHPPEVKTEDTLRHLQSLVQGSLGSLQDVGNPDTVALAPLTKVYKLSEEEAAYQKAGHAKGDVLRKLAPSIVVGGLST